MGENLPFDRLLARFEFAVCERERLGAPRLDRNTWIDAVEECDLARENLMRWYHEIAATISAGLAALPQSAASGVDGLPSAGAIS